MPDGGDKEGEFTVFKTTPEGTKRPVGKRKFKSGHDASIEKHPLPIDPETGKPVGGLSKSLWQIDEENNQAQPSKKEKSMPMGGVPKGDQD